MHILIFPVGFILWYLAYEAKPMINDEVTLHWEEKNSNKRTVKEKSIYVLLEKG